MKKSCNRSIRNPVKFIFKGILYPFLGWIFIFPLTLLIPRRKNHILLIGRSGGGFLDNIKYLFLLMSEMNENETIRFKFRYLTEDRNLYDRLKKAKLNVALYPKLKTFWYMLRTGLLIIDNVDWIQNNKYHFFIRAKKIQLWHGIFLKKIELDNPHIKNSMRSKLIKLHYLLKGRFPVYDLLLSPSSLYTRNVFSNAILSKKIYEAAYPRMDCLSGKKNDLYMIGTDKDAIDRMDASEKRGDKLVLYAPTFRDTGGDVIPDEYFNISSLSEFGKEYNITFVLKFHRWGSSDNTLITKEMAELDNIIFYNNSKDIYPLLPRIDLLITDYSSIFLEYLVLNKAVLFYPFDYDNYIKNDRTMYFDYDEMTPGPKAKTFEQLKDWIKYFLIDKKDGYEGQRQKILNKTFRYTNGNGSKRVINKINEEFLT